MALHSRECIVRHHAISQAMIKDMLAQYRLLSTPPPCLSKHSPPSFPHTAGPLESNMSAVMSLQCAILCCNDALRMSNSLRSSNVHAQDFTPAETGTRQLQTVQMLCSWAYRQGEETWGGPREGSPQGREGQHPTNTCPWHFHHPSIELQKGSQCCFLSARDEELQPNATL